MLRGRGFVESGRQSTILLMKHWILAGFLLGNAGPAVRGESPATDARWTQKQFIITFWCPPPATDEALARVAAEGFNLTWTPPEGLDLAAKHKLRAMLQSGLLQPEVLDDTVRRAELDALIQRVKNHPALEAYYLTDEPGAGAFAGLARLVAYLRERDPQHVAYINLFPTNANEQQLGVSADAAERARVGYPTDFAGVDTSDKAVLRYREHLKQFVEIVRPDLISYDHYHFLKGSDGKQYFLNLGLIRRAALEARKPFLNIIQADTIEKSWRLPNADEMRWLVFTTMAYGGRGISYFTYWGPKAYNGLYQDGQPAPLLQPVVALNQEIAKFGPALMELESLGAYQTAPLPYGAEALPHPGAVQIAGKGAFVVGVFGKDGSASSFMIVNRYYMQQQTATVRVMIPGRKLQELDRKTGEWTRGQTLNRKRVVEIKLAPGDGRLFRLSK